MSNRPPLSPRSNSIFPEGPNLRRYHIQTNSFSQDEFSDVSIGSSDVLQTNSVIQPVSMNVVSPV